MTERNHKDPSLPKLPMKGYNRSTREYGEPIGIVRVGTDDEWIEVIPTPFGVQVRGGGSNASGLLGITPDVGNTIFVEVIH